jgi:hypothetical protein
MAEIGEDGVFVTKESSSIGSGDDTFYMIRYTVVFSDSFCRTCTGDVESLIVYPLNSTTMVEALLFDPNNSSDTNGVFFNVEETTKGSTITKEGLDNLFHFSADLGMTYTGNWKNGETLIISIDDNAGASLPPATSVDFLKLQLRNDSMELKSADLSSISSTSSSVLNGSWGDFEAPMILSLNAFNGNSSMAGVDDGDLIVISFDVDTNTPDVSTRVALESVFEFSAPLGANC